MKDHKSLSVCRGFRGDRINDPRRGGSGLRGYDDAANSIQMGLVHPVRSGAWRYLTDPNRWSDMIRLADLLCEKGILRIHYPHHPDVTRSDEEALVRATLGLPDTPVHLLKAMGLEEMHARILAEIGARNLGMPQLVNATA
ncbi:MAG: hypothetical protein WC846_05110 [Candidatus Gracilibacteria bacterium]